MSTRQACLPSNYVNTRPHGPFEQLDGGGFANPSCSANKDCAEVLYAIRSLRIRSPHGLA
jgi:hypothetical protein